MYHALFLHRASLFSASIPTTHPPLCVWDSHMTHGRSELIHPSQEKTWARCFTNQEISWAVQSRQWESCMPTSWDQPGKPVQIKGNKIDCLLITAFWHQVWHQVNKLRLLSPQLLTTGCQETVWGVNFYNITHPHWPPTDTGLESAEHHQFLRERNTERGKNVQSSIYQVL